MKRFFLFAAIFSIAVPLFAQKKNRTPAVLFTVDQKPVYTDEFEYVYRKNNRDKEGKATKSDIDDYLNLFINFKLKVAEAQRRGMDTTRSFHDEFEKYHDELRKPYLPEDHLIDSLTALTYQRLKEEIKASHILIAVKEDAAPADTLAAYHKALQIKNEIQSGEPFDSLALRYSDDPSVNSNNGELGYFTALQMIYPFEDAAYTAHVGDVVGPVRTRFGYHLIRVEDRRPASGQVEVSHIMVRTGTSHSNDDAHQLIGKAYDELKKGTPWNDVCRKYSEDPNTKNDGGRLRPFGIRDMAGVPTFEEQAFALKEPGQYSQPFQTAFGWHIVRLERHLALAPFDQMKDELTREVSHDERSSMSMERLMQGLAHKFHLIGNDSLKHALWEQADSTLQQGKWKPDPQKWTQPLFTLNGQQVSAADFVGYIISHEQPNRSRPSDYLDRLYQGFLDARLVDEQEKQLIANNADYRFLLKEYHEGILLFDIMEQEVWNKASADTVGQQTYFNDHKNDYYYGERIHAILYKGTDKAVMDSLKQLFNTANDSVAERFASKEALLVETGDYEKNDQKLFQQVPFEEGSYTAEEDGNYYLVHSTGLIPPGPKSYEEARAEVISDYQDQLEKKWVEQLKSEFEVQVNAKGKKAVYRDLL